MPDPAETKPEQDNDNGRWKRLRLIQGYVLIVLGAGLIIYSVIPPVHAAALTIGGAMVSFNPMIKAASDH